jgi:hypothetical protein
VSAYSYRIKKGQVRLVTEEDFDLPKPTEGQLTELRSRMTSTAGYVTKLTPDHVLERLTRERAEWGGGVPAPVARFATCQAAGCGLGLWYPESRKSGYCLRHGGVPA